MSTPGEGDKRKVTTDALETLGSIITENEKRDAIHIAVENVIARQTLYPGQHVGAAGTVLDPVGIVDPFLKNPVYPGERFWLLIYPRQIHSLRHVWTHPAFDGEPFTLPHKPNITITPNTAAAAMTSRSKAKSEKWLRDFVSSSDCPDFDTVMEAALDHSKRESGRWDDEYLHFGDSASGSIPPEFWEHFEVYSGVTVPQDLRAVLFSCSC